MGRRTRPRLTRDTKRAHAARREGKNIGSRPCCRRPPADQTRPTCARSGWLIWLSTPRRGLLPLARFGGRRARLDRGAGVCCGEAEELFVLGSDRELLVGVHLGADDASAASLRVVEVHRPVVGLIEVSDYS